MLYSDDVKAEKMPIMFRGMTGYAHVEIESHGILFSIDISSVNKRNLEIVSKIPPEYAPFELEMRRALQSVISRGHLSVHVRQHKVHSSEKVLPCDGHILDENKVERQKTLYQALAHAVKLRLTKKDLFELLAKDIEKLSQHTSQETASDPSVTLYQLHETSLRTGFSQALEILLKKKEEEGLSLLNECLSRLHELRRCHTEVALKLGSSEARIQQYKAKFEAILKPFVSNELLSDDRMMREIVLLADKYDASEEMHRIEHHLASFEDLLANRSSLVPESKRKEGVGKTIEFLLQELLREFNTLGAKTSDSDISTLVIIAKTEIEKMREQIQNVE